MRRSDRGYDPSIHGSVSSRIPPLFSFLPYSRILHAWEHANVSVDDVVNDILQAFHHPTLRHNNVEIQRNMFNTVKTWVDEHPRRNQLDQMLSSESVKLHKNQILNQQQHGSSGGGGANQGHSHSPFAGLQLGHGKVANSIWSQIKTRDLDSMSGRDGDPSTNYQSSAPAPSAGYNPPQGHGYGHNPDYQGGYNAPAPPSYSGQPPPQGGHYGGHGGYGNQPPQQQYGGPGPGAPPQPQYGQHPPPHDQYGGQYGNQYGGNPRY